MARSFCVRMRTQNSHAARGPAHLNTTPIPDITRVIRLIQAKERRSFG